VFDPKQLIVLGNAIGSRQGPGFNLTRVRGDGEIGDERIFSFA